MDIKTVDFKTEHWPKAKRFKQRAKVRGARIKAINKKISILGNSPSDKHAKAKIAALIEERKQCEAWMIDAETQITNWFKD